MAAKFWVLAGALVIDSSNNALRFKENGGTTRTATIPDGTYFATGEGDASDLLKAVGDAMSSAPSSSHTHTLAYAGKVTTGEKNGNIAFNTTGSTVQLIASGTTFPIEVLGYTSGSEPLGASLAADISPQLTWCGDQPAVEREAHSDVSKTFESRTPAGHVFVAITGDDQEMRDMLFEYINGDRLLSSQAAEASDPQRAFQAWRRIMKDGRDLRLYLPEESAGTLAVLTSSNFVGQYNLSGDIISALAWARTPSATNGFDFRFALHPAVS